MTKSLTLLLSLGFILGSIAALTSQQGRAGTHLTAAEVLNQLQAKAKTLKSLKGSFEQRKYSRLLVKPMESEGELFWQPPGRFRWQVVRPAPLTLVVREDKILLLYPDLKKVTLYTGPSGVGFLDRITGATGDSQTFQSQYGIEVQLVARGEDRSWIQMNMEPKSAKYARYFKRLEVKIDPETWLPNEVAILEGNDDWTLIYLSNLTENSRLSDALFSVEPPEGFQVQSYGSGRRP
ncbi:MAG: outer membrane lipoprotein carrier protein LolA [Deltaproteobacteria bacterium]|nr:MAG: outer membrane lipoprotein carrier protein LolA [Deltaproteobacteria bacterium]